MGFPPMHVFQRGMPLKQIRFLIVLFVGCAATGWAKGKTAAVPFLTLDVSGRASGMGGAQSAAVNDASALVANPAALRELVRPSASLFHASYVDSGFYDFAGFGRRVGRAGAYGVGAQFFSQGTSERTDVDGNTTGNLTPSDFALSVGYAHDFLDFVLGVGGKYIQSKLANSASDVAMDAGILSPLFMENKWRFAATVSNVGPPIQYDSQSQPLPTRARIGATFSPTSRWIWAADAVIPNAGDTFGALGVEYHLPMEGLLKVDVRGGYNTQSKDLESMSGYSGGIGFTGPHFGVDYALVTLGELGLSHRFSLNFCFGQETKPPPPKKFPLRLPE
ncbi:MAG: PorV/PorQ family protein [Elusimicrobia bacterium]|nr:PorV/PorQ family protein [Elusimicrobiota bacterium]